MQHVAVDFGGLNLVFIWGFLGFFAEEIWDDFLKVQWQHCNVVAKSILALESRCFVFYRFIAV